ncbi:MAG TPA: ribulose-phosphate 3-epimerase, partial [Paludibacteraceae bacterium]|nr:ribulose-phosphate 3-epimerase [Paludibacteraceae bacterium]
PFIEETYERMDELKKMMELKKATCLLEVDGGVNLENAPKLFSHGANVLVAGSSIFKAENPLEIIQQMKNC